MGKLYWNDDALFELADLIEGEYNGEGYILNSNYGDIKVSTFYDDSPQLKLVFDDYLSARGCMIAIDNAVGDIFECAINPYYEEIAYLTFLDE